MNRGEMAVEKKETLTLVSTGEGGGIIVESTFD